MVICYWDDMQWNQQKKQTKNPGQRGCIGALFILNFVKYISFFIEYGKDPKDIENPSGEQHVQLRL
jgi:hypothetical protein